MSPQAQALRKELYALTLRLQQIPARDPEGDIIRERCIVIREALDRKANAAGAS